MSTADIPGVPGAPSRPPRHRHGFRRGTPRGHAGIAASRQPDASLAMRPASVGPDPVADIAQPLQSDRGNRGGRGGRGRGRRGGGPMMVNGQRVFGGQLTGNSAAVTPGERVLAGDAPEFVPGRPVGQRARPSQAPMQAQPRRARRMSKSQAPDIATRTHEDITNGQYECVICTNEVLHNSKIWTCKTCWSVLHLSCVKRWAGNEVSTLQQRAVDNGELPPLRQWRCPGCNLPKEELPNHYTCWCAKEIDPRSVAGLPPHSCGQTCSKRRSGRCPHPCELICHAGPCPPCGHMGPSLPCYCGKEASSKRCVETNYDSGWSCEQLCGDLLPCGEHVCGRPCHEGLCGSCEVMIDSRCYCGKVEKSMPCSERNDEHESQLAEDSWLGTFDCGTECRRPFDCGKPEHFCEKTCHPQVFPIAHCPYSPDVVTHCPCGKTPLEMLLSKPREDCSASIPHCQEKCQKSLQCGHLCQQICHEGECIPCLERVEIACRCGRTTSNSVCHQGLEEPPLCARICRSTLNCGRHECGERCCPGEKKATERQVSKRKHRALNDARGVEEFIEAEHICLKTCGRPLKCGNHSCAELCHKGPCRSCLEAVFSEISCACGRTVLQPPQPCGSQPPECRFDCTRQRTCGHPQVKHQCHADTEPCPKCPFLVERHCICGRNSLKNQPCWFSEVRCGLPCGKKLKCGIHTCQKNCHRQGQCEDVNSPCSQPCGRKKTVCEHSCLERCHAPYPCKENTACQAKTFITCVCQHQKQPVKCLASKDSTGNTGKTLDCNDECLKLIRNTKLAAALNIDPSTHTDDHIPYSSTTLTLYQENTKFAQQYERELRVFAAHETEKRIRFKPMQPHQRAFLHALAEDFGLDSESQDPEPHRHVSIFKTPRFVSAPMKTVGQCVKIRSTATVEPASSIAMKALVASAEPWNAFLLTSPKFGITIEELHADLASEFLAAGLDFDIQFLPSGDSVLRVLPTSNWFQKIEPSLIAMKAAVSKKVSTLKLASLTSLCAVDLSLNILRKEEDGDGSRGGWSQVAKGASGVKRMMEQGVGSKSSFTILGSKKRLEQEKERQRQNPVDDWEKEVEGWDDV